MIDYLKYLRLVVYHSLSQLKENNSHQPVLMNLQNSNSLILVCLEMDFELGCDTRLSEARRIRSRKHRIHRQTKCDCFFSSVHKG